MRILVIRFGTFPPDVFAGTELTLHWLCRNLVANGHEVMAAVQSTTRPDGQPVLDEQLGYRTIRAKSVVHSVAAATKIFQPDVVVIAESGKWTEHILPLIGNRPIVVYEHEFATAPIAAPQELKKRAVYIANSAVTSANLLKICGVRAEIVPPLFGVARYAGIERSGNRVLFVSLQRRKGSDVAIRIAQLRPKYSFVFIESWTEKPEQTQRLREFVNHVPNIELLPNQPSLEKILPQIRLLLMPSRSQEAWGRTATEAQICGIPVLGSSRGNLPVTIGQGGVTLDPDEPIEKWLEAFDRIMRDPAVYMDLSRKAFAQGQAKIREVREAYRTFERALHEAAARQAA